MSLYGDGFKTMGSENEIICFCFGYTIKDIKDDVLKNGRSLILDKIMAEKKTGSCSCSLKNPKGR